MTSPQLDKETQLLRDAWIAAENARREAGEALIEAHKNSPLGIAYAAAKDNAKRAKEAFSQAFHNQRKSKL
ncbi:hypothetical protein [Mesorhizobium sp. BR-1-1-10]|uniref:hypothetical protein n=1 Tax=Mesorhizobium sp. BR-1-1-10 TaxID=2876660 RepID=UPI001CD0B154|nr:hypothetical protein [Mesorhizobium sp. BR-1-1-10]MBZ9975506.1 hypothetical protein [Mesorhizobium sp. BR-1-1-10]